MGAPDAALLAAGQGLDGLKRSLPGEAEAFAVPFDRTGREPGGDERFRVTANDPAELVECRDENNTAETTASCSILF